MELLKLPPGTSIGSVELRVPNAQRAVRFYREVLGLSVSGIGDRSVQLSARVNGDPLVRLLEVPNAIPRPPRTAGLFHVAFLFPDRRALANTLRRLIKHRWPLQGFADHGVSEAVYLADADGNGIELYCDRPRDRWPQRNGSLQMVTEPLDVEDLLRQASQTDDDATAVDPSTTIGHIHLQVGNITRAEAFYHKLVGFDVVQRSYPGALFLSAGGYHHHIGLNVWAGRDIPPAPPDATGLASFRITLPDETVWEEVERRLKEFHTVEITGDHRIRTLDADGIGVEFEAAAFRSHLS